MSLSQAADTLGISSTAMKRSCRKLGVARWPYRSGQAASSNAHIDEAYVRKIQRACERIPDWNTSPRGALGTIDGDTEVCHDSFSAALCAAGAVVEAVDRVVAGSAEKVFCAVRPPGHHAGPNGPVPAPGDPIGSGSHGFCLLNNVALGAAYARCVHRHSLRRVAIIDFDVHHGNGTEAVVQNTTPAAPKFQFSTPYCDGAIVVPTYRPWLDETDHEEVFFASVHGYGRRREGVHFYPGSGPTADNRNLDGREMLATEEPPAWPEEGIVDDPFSVAQAKDDSTAQGPYGHKREDALIDQLDDRAAVGLYAKTPWL